MTLSVQADRRLVRSTAHSIRYLLVEIGAPTAPRRDHRPPVNLALVLDRSGSMQGAKIATARDAVREAIERLDADDRFSVVVYDDRIDVVAESEHATEASRRRALDRLAEIDARGSTNLAEGWLRGCEQVAAHLSDAGVNRCLLLTDGLANVGITDPAELERHAAELRRRGVQTSTFGAGEDFDERLLESMADAGGGHFYFIASPAQIRDHVTTEVGETLEVVARDVAVTITAADGLRGAPLSPIPAEGGGTRTTLRVGDLVSGQVVRLVVELTFPYGEPGRQIGVLVGLSDRDGVLAAEPVTVAFEYADHGASDRQERNRAVDREVARIYAARARQEAVRLNRTGDFELARHQLRAVSRRILAYTGRDPVLREIVAELQADELRYSVQMSESLRKEVYFAASAPMRSRSMDGRAIRQGDDEGDRA